MKLKFVFALWTLAWLAVACAPVTTPTPQGDQVGTMVAATLQALTAAAPTATAVPPTQAQPLGAPVSFGNVSFVIPQGLALGATGESAPAATEENGGPWGAAPAHIHFTLYGYNNVLAKFSVMEISVFPTQEYANANAGAEISLPRLQTILAAPNAPIDPKNLPGVPYFNAAQMFAAQVKVIPFASGSGVRMVTQYGQAAGPITNNGTFYHFEGLTSDGKYYVIAILPIGAPVLSAGGQTGSNDPNVGLPQGGIPFPGYDALDPKEFDSYYQAVTDKLNAVAPVAFSPSLSSLDALVQSITITP